jgi:hypothetical protein
VPGVPVVDIYPAREHAPLPGQMRAGPHLMGKFRRSVGL